MADLTTYTMVEAELAATADYDVSGSLDKARRRVVALRRKLDFAEEANRNGQSHAFNFEVIAKQLDEAKAWAVANGGAGSSPGSADVIHADFSRVARF